MTTAALGSCAVRLAGRNAAAACGRAKPRCLAQTRPLTPLDAVSVAQRASPLASAGFGRPASGRIRGHAATIVCLATTLDSAGLALGAIVVIQSEAGPTLELAATIIATCDRTSAMVAAAGHAATALIVTCTHRPTGPTGGAARGLAAIAPTLATPRGTDGNAEAVLIPVGDASRAHCTALTRRLASRRCAAIGIGPRWLWCRRSRTNRRVVGPRQDGDAGLPLALRHHRSWGGRRRRRRRRGRGGSEAAATPRDHQERQAMAAAQSPQQAEKGGAEPRQRCLWLRPHRTRGTATALSRRPREHVDACVDEVELSLTRPREDPQPRAHHERSVVGGRAGRRGRSHQCGVAHNRALAGTPGSSDHTLDEQCHPSTGVVLDGPLEDHRSASALLLVGLGRQGRPRGRSHGDDEEPHRDRDPPRPKHGSS